MLLPAGHNEVERPAVTVDERMNLGRAPAAADADRLTALPPFAPAAARCALMMVLSIICRLSRSLAASAANIRPQMPRTDQRLKRPAHCHFDRGVDPSSNFSTAPRSADGEKPCV